MLRKKNIIKKSGWNDIKVQISIEKRPKYLICASAMD